jgi:hypothetical protein
MDLLSSANLVLGIVNGGFAVLSASRSRYRMTVFHIFVAALCLFSAWLGLIK